MFGYRFLIFNMLSWLALLSPQKENEIAATPQSSFEVVISTEHKQSAAIIEMGSNLYEIIDTTQNVKLPSAVSFNKIQEAHTVSYESRLLYFHIGNAIELELTSTTIIFPFHCFT